MSHKKTLKLGLTGGIGSGKSTVAAFFAQHGATVIDADAISRSTTAAGGSAIPAIAAQFGPTCIGPDGAMDRDQVRRVVFSDPVARARLEQIIHPLVGREIQSRIADAERKHLGCAVIEIPLLVESGRWRPALHKILTIDCRLEEQVLRVMTRSGLGREDALRVIQSQATREARLSAADMVLYNQDLSLAELRGKVDQLCMHLAL